MTHIIERYLERTTKDRVLPKTKGHKGCGLDKKADLSIKHCIKCNHCWEPKARPDNSSTKYMWYKNFPAYGKEKKLCPKCQIKNNEH